MIFEPADRSDLPEDVPRTWIMTLRDRALSVRQQLDAIKSLGGVDTMVCLDACHNVMFSEPTRLAAILADRCRLPTFNIRSVYLLNAAGSTRSSG